MPKVISEIGCNHKGSIQIALEMIKASAQCGANIAKFQKRNVLNPYVQKSITGHTQILLILMELHMDNTENF